MQLRLAVILTSIVALLSLGVASANAVTPTTTYATLWGNGGWVTGNNSWLWQGAQVSVSGSVDTRVQVSISDGTNDFTMLFTPPPGQSLTAGTYANAVREGSQQPGQAGIDVFGDGRGCNAEAGSFTVNSIAPDLSSVSIDYQADCEGSSAARSQGSIRYQVDPSTVALVAVPGTAYFPTASRAAPSHAVVNLYNLGSNADSVSSAGVTTGADSFSVTSNNCGTLAAGGQCAIGLAFAPSTTGVASGVLSVTDSASNSYPIDLQGVGIPTLSVSLLATTFAYGARTSVTAHISGASAGQNVTMTAIRGGITTALGTKPVGSTGAASFSSPALTSQTQFVATWTDGTSTVHASIVAKVHAKVAITESGARAKSGSYWLYTAGHNIEMVGTVAPGKAGECVAMTAQYWYRSAWHTLKTLSCDTLNSSSRAGAVLKYGTSARSHSWRFRAYYRGDSTNLAATSAWLYARWG